MVLHFLYLTWNFSEHQTMCPLSRLRLTPAKGLCTSFLDTLVLSYHFEYDERINSQFGSKGSIWFTEQKLSIMKNKVKYYNTRKGQRPDHFTRDPWTDRPNGEKYVRYRSCTKSVQSPLQRTSPVDSTWTFLKGTTRIPNNVDIMESYRPTQVPWPSNHP